MKNHKDQRKEVVFFKIGGAWASEQKNGSYFNKGVLDTEEIYTLEKELGFFTEHVDYPKLEWQLTQKVYKIIQNASKQSSSLNKELSFIPNFNDLVKGKYIELCNASSSLFRTSFIAALLTFFLQYAQDNP